jgi:hypothetical protein
MEMDNLTDYQQEQMTRFLEVSSIYDDKKAIAILRQTNWNVPIALEIAFSQDTQEAQERVIGEEKDNLIEASAGEPSTVSQSRPNPSQDAHQQQAAVADNSWRNYILKNLESLTKYIISWIPEFLLDWIPTWLMAYKSILVASSAVTSTPLQQFREEYGPLLPNFTDIPLSVLMGQVTTNPLFLYFHSRSHGDTDAFCARTLGNENVINYLDSNFRSWFGSKVMRKNWRLAAQLNVSSYPYICVLSPRQGRPDATRFNLSFEHAGPMDAPALLSALKNAQENFQLELARSVAHDMQLQDDRELRVQQEADYTRMIDEEKKRIEAKKRRRASKS